MVAQTSSRLVKGLSLISMISATDALGCNSILGADNYTIEPAAVAPTRECESNKQCIEARAGEPYICRKTDGRCVSLLSEDCQALIAEKADLESDDALLLGSVQSTTGADQSGGLPIENAIRLATAEFRTLGGLPPLTSSSQRRPVIVVGCTDTDDAIRAATHLVDDLRVPAIIGATFSGATIRVAQKVTIPGGVLLMSPAATSVYITTLQDDGLVWRTSPPDSYQAVALAGIVLDLETKIRTERKLASNDSIRVAVLHKGDSYGKGVVDVLIGRLRFNGKSAIDNKNDYLQFDYGDPDDQESNPTPGIKYAECVSRTEAFRPHLVLLAGTTEGITDIVAKIETTLSDVPDQRPIYLMSDGAQLPETIALVGNNPELRSRLWGTVPGTDGELYKRFLVDYNSTFHDGTIADILGPAGGYDAVYLLAYAAVAARDTPITGSVLAKNLMRLSPPGESVGVGRQNINKACTALQAGLNIDFDGASGPLDFDGAIGESGSNIQAWCVKADATGKAVGFQRAGRTYNAKTGLLEGTLECP